MARRIGTLIGHGISPIVESLDVNAIVNEIDIEEIIDKVDMNHVMDKIDMDKLVDRIDWNAILDRVDVNRHLDRVDIDRILQRSNLEEIISRATSGVWTECIDLIRTRIAWLDQWIQRICQFGCFKKYPLLPPRPGRPQDSKKVWPKMEGLRAREFGLAVQFRTCGACCRVGSGYLDLLLLLPTFALWAAIFNKLGQVFSGDEDWELDPNWMWIPTVLFFVYAFLYQICLLACFGRSFGMWLLGLLLVSRDGHRPTMLQIIVQTLCVGFNIAFFGWVISLLRRDGKMWSELISRTAMVYAWNTTKVQTTPRVELAMSMNEYFEAVDLRARKELLGSNKIEIDMVDLEEQRENQNAAK